MALNPLQQQLQAGTTPPTDVSSAGEALDKQFAAAEPSSEDPESQAAAGAQDDGLPPSSHAPSAAGPAANDTTGPTAERADPPEQGTDPEASAADPAAEGAEEAEAPTLESIKTVAELEHALGADGFVNDLTITIGQGEQQRDIPIKSLMTHYANARRSADTAERELARQQHEFQQQSHKSVEQFQAASVGMSAQLDEAMQRVQELMRGSGHADLRTNDPGEWAARDREYESTLARLQQTRQQLSDQYAQAVQQARDQYIQAESAKLSREMPGWGRGKFDEAMQTIMSFGFTAEEAYNSFDSRLIKAALGYRQMSAENAALKKQLAAGKKAAATVKKTVPLLKPGGGKIARRGNRAKVTQLRQRVAKTGSVRDAGAAIAAQLFGDEE